MDQSKTVIGLNALRLWDEFGHFGDWLTPVLELIATGKARPVIAETFSFDRAPEVHRCLNARRNVGKVVLTP